MHSIISVSQSLDSLNDYVDAQPTWADKAYAANTAGISIIYNDLEKGRDFFNLAYTYALKSNDPYQIATSKCNFSMYYMFKGRFDTAKSILLTCAPVLHNLDSLTELSAAYSNIGVCYYSLGQIDSAIFYYLKSLEIDEELGDEGGVAVIYSNIGDILVTQEEYERAKPYYLKAAEIDFKLGNEGSYAQTMNGLGIVSFQTNEPDSAEYYLHTALHIFERLEQPYGLAKTLIYLGRFEFEREQYENGLMYLFRARDIQASIKNVKEIVTINSEIAQVYMKIESWKEVEKVYYEILDLIKDEPGYITIRATAHDCLSITREKNKDYKSALYHQRQFKLLADSISDFDHKKLISELHAKFENDKKENQLNLLRKDNASIDLALSKTQQAWGITVLASLLIGFLAFRFLKQKNKVKELNNVLINQSQELQQLNQLKDQIFSILSHDLRSPVASLQMLMDMVFNNNTDPVKAKKYYKELQNHLNQTVHLMENLLVWSVNQLKNHAIEKKELNLNDVIQEAESLFSFNLKEKGIALRKEMANDKIYGDENMVKSIVRNLISNALKFSHKSEEIFISSKKVGDMVELMVKDNGIGMDSKTSAHLFDYQNSASGTSEEKGIGLGMKLVHDFVILQNGEIKVISHPGKGTQVLIKLPAA